MPIKKGNKPFVGVFLNPIYVQVEGLNSVFDTLEKGGVTAVATAPYVAEILEEGQSAERFPDLHVDGHLRTLARPILGRKEIQVRKYSTLVDSNNLFAGQRYRPRQVDPSRVDDDTPAKIIAEAQRRGMEAHLQLSPFLVPGIQEQDLPTYPDGTKPSESRVSNCGCPNSDAVRQYALSCVELALNQYDTIDGLFLDWTEYGAYTLEDNFTSFSGHSRRQAERRGFDWSSITRDVGAAWQKLHQLEDNDLSKLNLLAESPSALLGLMVKYPGWLEFLRFKSETISSYYRDFRSVINSTCSDRKVQLSARGWPPPWNISSGMDYGSLSSICDNITPKFFSFDYCAMPKWYAETLLRWNPSLDESKILDILVSWMNLPDDKVDRKRSDYYIPGPSEEHPAHLSSYRQRLAELSFQTSARARLRPFAHAYMPENQWEAMVTSIEQSDAEGIWVQMYGYLSDKKLEILKENFTKIRLSK